MCEKGVMAEVDLESGGADGAEPNELAEDAAAAGTWAKDVQPDGRLPWPEERTDLSCLRSTLERWTYHYMRHVLDAGARQSLADGTHLAAGNLFAVPRSMESEHLAALFWRHHSAQDSGLASRKRLMGTLWRIAAPTFVPAGLCQLVTVFCQVGMPLLVRQLLTILEQNPGESVVRQGLPYAVAIFLDLVLNGFFNHRQRHLAMKTGVRLRAALITVLYERVLRLTPRGRSGLTSGQVSTLVSVDSQKLFEVTQEGHLLWSLPLSVVLVTGVLLKVMGPTTLVGIAILILFVPIVGKVTATSLAIRQKRVAMTDQRIEIINAMLQGIKVTKLNNYEANYEKRVMETREKEVALLRKELAVWACTLFMTVLSPVIATAATFSVYVLVDEDNILTAAKSFSVLLLFAALRFPINYAGRLVGRAAQALSAINRLARFLERDVRESFTESNSSVKQLETASDLPASEEGINVPLLQLSKASFAVGDKQTGLVVSEFNLKVHKGEVLAVCGVVGGGKSSFVSGIIDELPLASPEALVRLRGKVAFVPQTPFILNATLRDNILFGLPYDRAVYEQVLDVCQLRQDIEQLGKAGDLTEIGERGVTLSGGQKQRVSLARAAYSQPDLVLLDDPLSALDAGTAKEVFKRLVRGDNAFFRDSAVVLVTHATQFLSRCDRILLMVDGTNKFLGTWEDLSTFQPKDMKTREAVEHMRSSVQESQKRNDDEEADTEEVLTKPPSSTDALMTVEDREHGLSSWNTWMLWFRRAGGWFFLGTLTLAMIFDRMAYVALELWLARWTAGADDSISQFGIEFPPQTDGRSAQYQYLKVYSLILVFSIISTIIRSEWAVTGGTRAACEVFSKMLGRVLGCPISYFETTPMGRILNRFTYDMEVVDVSLTQSMSVLLISLGWYFTGVILMAAILPYSLCAIVPVTWLYWLLLLHYRKSGADLQRLDAVSRSPVQAMVTEGLDGCSTIRILRKQMTFMKRYFRAVDDNTSALLNFVSAQRWLGLRIELLGSMVVLVTSTLVVCLNDVFRLSPGIIGLLVIWSSNFTITLGFLVDAFGETEAAITAIERVDAMSRLKQERSMKTEENMQPPPSWPDKGNLEFRNVCLRYREGLPLALNNLSFSVPAGKRVAIVGRTGAGKSSLTVALFRLVEIESGRIELDGVDLGTLGLSDVRGRTNGMAIIPQDPFLAGTSVRQCLDPFGQSEDAEITAALEAVRLGDIVTLDSLVHEGGANFSVGERQLFNLARALLSQPKVLILDEATASIDGATDAFIQKMLRTRFHDTTLITVAHRLNTVMDYDLIVAMHAGMATEVGEPKELLMKADSLFAELVEHTGPDSAKALRAMAGLS